MPVGTSALAHFDFCGNLIAALARLLSQLLKEYHMKHISIFTSLLLASVSVHAACPDEINYLAPAELQPQCEAHASPEYPESDAQPEDAATSTESTDPVTPEAQASTELK